MSEPALLLGAKLLPPAPGRFHLARRRLHRRVVEGLEGRATAIVAGPGYGKTSLAARFIQDEESDSVWYSLDESDRDPWMFFSYLREGVRGHVPEFGERSAGLWQSLRSRPDELDRLADVFLRDAEESLDGRTVIVLDGVEALAEGEGPTRALRRLLAYLPGTLHLFLIGRSLPEIGARALHAEGRLNSIRGEELLFTPEETRELLVETFGLSVDPAAVERVHSRTRGWVTGLQLLRQTARLERDAGLPDDVFEKTEVEVFEYFSEEVLAAEQAPERELLLISSLPPVVDPDVVGEVLGRGDIRVALGRLVEQQLFLSPLESRGELFSYTPLFRDFLLRKLRIERGDEGVQGLHGSYGGVYARRGDVTQALGHLIAARDVAATARLVERNRKALLQAGMLESVRDAARFLEQSGVRAALVEDLLGEAARRGGDHAAAIGHFEAALAYADESALAGAARAAALQGLAYSLQKMGEMERASRTAREALAEAGDGDPALVARILNTLSIVDYLSDRHAEARDGWQEALARSRQAGDQHLTLMIAHNLGLPHAVAGDFQRASECFRLLTDPENPRLGPEEGVAYLNLARIATLRGEYAEAASLLDDAGEIARKWKLRALAAETLEAQANLLRETGELERAAESYAAARARFTELGMLGVLDNLGEEEALLAARRGDAEQAERLAAELVERAERSGDPARMASARLALGQIRARAGDPAAAAEPLARAAEEYRERGRHFDECTAMVHLALARARGRQAEAAAEAGERALRLAARFDYGGLVKRVAALDADLAATLAALPAGAPFALGAVEPAAVAAGEPAAVGLAADLTVRLLGPVEVRRGPAERIPPAAWKVRRALQIFCFLASSRNRRATKDRIVDAVWEDARPSTIEKNFHPTISFLRRALNHGHKVTKHFILYEAGAYQFNPDYRYEIDTETFEERLRSAKERAERGDAEGAAADYDRAIALYRGPFLEEHYESWTEPSRTHFDQLLRDALREAARLHLARGDAERGLGHLERLVEASPLDESASKMLMEALGEQGRRGEVEQEFRRLEKALRQALSTAPLPETRQVYVRARKGRQG